MKEKRYSISILDNKQVIQEKDATFYTTDNDAWLTFKLAVTTLNPETATITLINLNDKSVVSESVVVENKTLRYHMRPEIIEHAGQWQVQLIFIEGDKEYTSAQISFRVHGHILDDSEPRLEIIENWNTFTQSARDFLRDLEGDHDVWLERIENLEEEYAPKLTEVTAQLAQKANKDALGIINQDLQTTKESINDIVTSPAGSVSEQEIIEARKGKETLGSKIEDIDTTLLEQNQMIYDTYYRYGRDYPEKHGGWQEGANTGTTVGQFSLENDHIKISFENTGGVGRLGITTNNLVDMTSVSSLFIDWEVTGGGGSYATFGVGKAINTPHSVLDKRQIIGISDGRKVSKVDLEDINGEYRLHIQPYTTTTNGNIELKVYNVYGANKLMDGYDAVEIENKIKNISNSYSQQIYGDINFNLYTEKSTNNGLHVKFTSGILHLREGRYGHDYTNGIMLASVGSEYVGTSPDGVENCINIANSHSLVVDLTDGLSTNERLKIIHRNSIDYFSHIVLISVVNGDVVSGVLRDIIQDGEINKLKLGNVTDSQVALDNTLHRNIMQSGADDFRLMFITDTHGEGGALLSSQEFVSNVSSLENNRVTDLIVHGGDIIDGYLPNKSDALKNLMSITKPLNGYTPSAFIFGNHDDNSYHNTSNVTTDFKISNEEWYKHIVTQFKDDFVFNGIEPLSRYFYKDFEDKKIRVVFLDSVDIPEVIIEGKHKWFGATAWGYGTDQINWIGNVALQLPDDDWEILVISHMGTQQAESGLPRNGCEFDNVFKAFNEKGSYENEVVGLDEWSGSIDVDLSNAKGTIIGHLFGHVHRDEITINPVSGVTQISTHKSQRDTMGAFDIVSVNKKLKEVKLTRFGSGEDRSFVY